jgi:hypothetical protein
MGNTGRKSEPPKQADEKPKAPSPPPRPDDDDWEHGDIAAPNGEHYGNDDEPL